MSNTTRAAAFAEAANTIFGVSPEDVLNTLESAVSAFNWTEALFDAIGALYERSEEFDELRIKHLSEAGSFIAKHASTSAHESNAVWGLALDVAKARKGAAS